MYFSFGFNDLFLIHFKVFKAHFYDVVLICGPVGGPDVGRKAEYTFCKYKHKHTKIHTISIKRQGSGGDLGWLALEDSPCNLVLLRRL